MAAAKELITQLYVGYFNRAPDPEGLAYWVSKLEAGISLEAISESFADSEEAEELYNFFEDEGNADVAGIETFLKELYLNVFGREIDDDGLAFYTNEIVKGDREPGQIVNSILANAATNEGSKDKAYLANKVAAGLHFVEMAEELGDKFEWNDETQKFAETLLDGVTHDPATVEQAKAKNDQFVIDNGGTNPNPNPNPGGNDGGGNGGDTGGDTGGGNGGGGDDSATGRTEESVITFTALIAGQSVTVAGLTLAATGAMTAAEVAEAFSDKDTFAGAGTFTGNLSGWTVDTASLNGDSLTFRSATENTDVTDIDTSVAGTPGVGAPTEPTPDTSQGSAGASGQTEEHTVLFPGLLNGESVTVAGLTLAATNTLTAAEVAEAFSDSAAFSGNGTFTGSLSGWAVKAGYTLGDHMLTFTSGTSDTDVTDIELDSTSTVGAINVTASTQGSAATPTQTEETAITFTALTDGQSVTVADLTLTATGALSADEVAAAFSDSAAFAGNGTFSGNLTGWSVKAGYTSGAELTFVSDTPNMDVADIVLSTDGRLAIDAPAAPTVETTPGQAPAGAGAPGGRVVDAPTVAEASSGSILTDGYWNSDESGSIDITITLPRTGTLAQAGDSIMLDINRGTKIEDKGTLTLGDISAGSVTVTINKNDLGDEGAQSLVFSIDNEDGAGASSEPLTFTLDTTPPTAGTATFNDTDGDGAFDAGETITFTFSEEIGNHADLVNQLDQTKFGNSVSGTWNTEYTELTVTLSAGATVSAEDQIQFVGVQDLAGNSANLDFNIV